jgi:cytochrome c
LIGLLWLTTSSVRGHTPADPAYFSVLVFSKTTMYRHASITNGVAAIRKPGMENGFTVDATEDGSTFSSSTARARTGSPWRDAVTDRY